MRVRDRVWVGVRVSLLRLGLVLVLWYIWRLTVYMVSFTYVDLVYTVTVSSPPAHPSSDPYVTVVCL